ncbi:hypothetical protein F2Q69_00044128 [Brassica cretica]|uniref:Uncharacterized protein n=1 Tax=Brassica cretica TaxID=69181 RepID=A0A8S9NGS5_BRACR|nr:hypothetical protein F2Q69_00044128 [Brassica cretica]
MFFWLSGFGVPDRPLLPASHLVLRWSSGLSLWEAVAFIAHVSPALSPGFGGGVASFRWLYDPVAFAFYEHFFVWMVFTDLSLLMAELRRNPSGGGDGFRFDACLRIVDRTRGGHRRLPSSTVFSIGLLAH